MKSDRILFIAEGQLGDLLLLTPAIRAMKQHSPSSTISVLILDRRHGTGFSTKNPVSRQSGTPLEGNTNIENVFVVDREALRQLEGWTRLRAEWNILMFLRKLRIDIAVCTFPQDRFVIWSFAAGAATRVGQSSHWLHWLLTHGVKTTTFDKGVLEYHCDLVRILGASVVSIETEHSVPESEGKWADEFLKAHGLSRQQLLVTVHPGATGNYRVWPPERFAELIDALQTDHNVHVILCHGDLDVPVLQEIRSRLRTNVVVTNTGSNLGRLAAIVQRCSLCISNNSGPRHLTIALGIPSLALFPHHHDKEWMVYKDSDYAATLQGKHTCPVCPEGICQSRIPSGEQFGSECLRMVGVEEVVTRAVQILNGTDRRT